jgi:hypothetical protein
MPWADDLLKNLTPEQKRQLADGLGRAGRWLGDLAGQITAGRPAEAHLDKPYPEQGPSSARTQTARAMQADIQAIKRSGHKAADTLVGCVMDAYAGKPLPDDIWAMITSAIRMGNDMPIRPTSDNPPYVTLDGNHKPTNGIHKTDADASPGVQEGPRMRRMAMSREEYDLIQCMSPESGRRALIMAATFGLQSDTVAYNYDADSQVAYLVHPSFEPVPTGARTPMMERATLASDHAM